MAIVNLEILKPSRKLPAIGDTFALRPKGRPFYFGRVIGIVPEMAGGFPARLVYIYAASSVSADRVPRLIPSELLVPPMATNYLPWSKGYFKTVSSQPLCTEDILDVHCFFDPVSRCYRNEHGKNLSRKLEPCGFFGLQSYRTIDDAISEAVGIPLSPE